MTRKQIAFIIGVNAVISAVISVVVALLVNPPASMMPASVPTTAMPVTEAVAPAPSATPGTVLHLVESGDTISGLSFKYDVPEADIIAANELQNPNFLQVGVELIIPVGGLSQATATLTPAPTATDTPIPFEPPSADMTATADVGTGATDAPLPTSPASTGEIEIEIAEIIAEGQVDQERVIINNLGERLADMQGWTLSDAEGNVYTFPNFRLWGKGSVTVHTRIGQDGSPPANFYWGKLEAVWSIGEQATLMDADGQVVDTYTVGR